MFARAELEAKPRPPSVLELILDSGLKVDLLRKIAVQCLQMVDACDEASVREVCDEMKRVGGSEMENMLCADDTFWKEVFLDKFGAYKLVKWVETDGSTPTNREHLPLEQPDPEGQRDADSNCWHNRFVGACALQLTTDTLKAAVAVAKTNHWVHPDHGPISEWDTSKVTDMSMVFFNRTSFNGDLSKWDTSKVTNMNSMFENCSSFNGDLSEWDTSNVTDMRFMFDEFTSLTTRPSWYVNARTVR